MLRKTKKFGSIQTYKPNRQTSVTDTDILVDNAHTIAQDVLTPAIQRKSQNAIKTDRIEIKYYQEMQVGRLCSCFKKEYDAPEMGCLVCFGTGRVGGYNLYGTYLDIIDTTKEGLTMLNVKINDEVWPWKFELCDGMLEGYVDAVIDIPSMQDVDIIRLYSSGNYVRALVRKYNDTAWHRLSRNAIRSLSSQNKTLVVRVILSRKTLVDNSPSFTHLYTRYRVMNNTLYVDMPKLGSFKNSDNFALTGLQTSQAFLTSELPKVSVNDVFKDLRRETMWRINEVTMNDPLGVLTSWDVEIRSIESFEIYKQIP